MELPVPLDTNGDWDVVCNRLYDCFCSIFFAEPRLLVDGRLLTVDGRRDDDQKVEGFWHIVTRGPARNRIPDFERARRMPWIPVMLDGTAEGLTRWKYLEGSGKTRQYYWLQDENYILILEEQRHVRALITAFFTDKKWEVEDLIDKRDKGKAF